MDYYDVPAAEAWKLMTTGGVVLIATSDTQGQGNLAPVAWSCPLDYEPVSQVLFVCDPKHHTLANIRARSSYAIILPSATQKTLIEQCGSTSGRENDKLKALGISLALKTPQGHPVPEDSAGWLDCQLLDIIDRGTACIVIGQIKSCQAVKEAWTQRLHLSPDDEWYTPGKLL